MAMATAVSVTASSGAVLAANPGRTGYCIINPPSSGQTVWVNIDGGTATAAPPCVPIAEGDSFTWRGTGAVTGIAGGSVTITVAEH